MLQEKYFNTGEVDINYAEGPPSGPPLVLVHGLPGRWQEFLPVIPSLALRWHIYAVDLRGQGRSGHIPGKYLPEDYTTDLTAFLDEQVSAPAVVFGMSAGGLIALKTAAQSPHLVRALILGDSPIDQPALTAWMSSEPFAAHFSAVRDLIAAGLSVTALVQALGELPVRLMGAEDPPRYKDLPGQTEAALLDWASTVHPIDPDVLAYHAAGRGDDFLLGLDIDAAYSQIPCPTLLIRADPKLGSLMSAEASQHAADLLPQATQVCLENHAHGLGLDTWAAAPLLRVVTSFLEALLQSTP